MEICLFIDELRSGGAEGQMLMLARGLAEVGQKVTLIVFYPSGPNYKRALQLEGVDVRTLFKEKSGLRVVSLFRHLSGSRKLRNYLTQASSSGRSVALYSFLEWPNIIAYRASRGIDKVSLVWGIRGADDKLSKWRGIAFSQAVKVSSEVDLVIANSSKGRDWHKASGFLPRNWALVENGIDVGRFRLEDSKLDQFRSKLSLEDGMDIVGIVGRLVPVKDHRTFLTAMSIVVRKMPNLRIIIAGSAEESSYEADLRALSEELGLDSFVTWMGHVQDVNLVYKICDVAVLSSISEGFPNAICEAMASGVPCVSTDVGDASIIIGELGTIVPKEDSRKMAYAVLEMFDNLINYPADKLRESISNRFSIEALARRTIKAIEESVKQ